MAENLSQNYGVDNRYRGLEDAADDQKGPQFLAQYLKQRKASQTDNITDQRRADDRFVLAGEGGTVPLTAFPYEPRGAASLSNTDRSVTFRNTFRTQPS